LLAKKKNKQPIDNEDEEEGANQKRKKLRSKFEVKDEKVKTELLIQEGGQTNQFNLRVRNFRSDQRTLAQPLIGNDVLTSALLGEPEIKEEEGAEDLICTMVDRRNWVPAFEKLGDKTLIEELKKFGIRTCSIKKQSLVRMARELWKYVKWGELPEFDEE